MSNTTAFATQTQTQQTRTGELDPFQLRFESPRRLPRELREEAMGMSWSLFTATYAPTPTLRISDIHTDKANWCYNSYSADVTKTSKTFPPQTTHHEVTASGPAHAFAAMLATEGRYIEILEFHQIELYEATFTAIKVAHQINERNTAWAIGFGPTSEASIAAAMSSGAQRIYG
ncbi:acetyl-CoA acetyltransferase [Corynebacterium genitalium ATCC 33030]|uniref:Acetyl-CoA acetyltransferase n=1 Tax=Corynebacterium genitalium ATCC 33030 TaxID=585529 RepID=D7W9W5_9CORY|nr:MULTISPECIES: hypothetical protein [Corynebacterium]EFK55582.1 hypothetical protein HMPREF0291_10840 [Corynebacterium genitalium ATCC 33030]MCQ4623622.1 acetyl-CoA acetyltransferase [Corynebacterium sp. CCUG 70398]UUA89194.1 acetyl-CoA acetyltransferase [Corynebacterium genitalium ATCC 33030]